MKSLPPESDTSEPEPEVRTDFQSLMEGGLAERQAPRKQEATDFQSLHAQTVAPRRRLVKRTTTDWLVDVLTPVMIFVMVYSVISFLIDVRYIYLDLASVDWISRMYDSQLRYTAFFFVMGVVALNRLIARDGKNESVLYIFGLVFAVGLYTLTTTDQLGSPSQSFVNYPPLAAAFNMTLVAIIWWITNRLTHECCVDENPISADIGILTGTARRIHNAITGASRPTGVEQKPQPVLYMQDLDAVDPSAWKKADKRKAVQVHGATSRLPKRHPGVSVFYASIPAMIAFAIGQQVLRHADADLAFKAHMRLTAYTVSALMLLMLSSLGGLREYFRNRNIRIPAGIGPFWVGVGTLMVAMVIVAAGRMPLPASPPLLSQVTAPSYNQVNTAKGDKTESENTSSRSDADRKNEPQPDRQPPRRQPDNAPNAIALRYPDVTRFFTIAQKVVLVCMGLVAVYALLRVFGALALKLSGGSDRLGQTLSRFFKGLDALLQSLLRVPSLPSLPRRRTVSRQVALSTRYRNPLGDPQLSRQMTPAEIVEYSYTALCALAMDAGVPRRADQTPFEYIASFPDVLQTLREEAIKLTNLYVVSAYSNITLDDRNLDTVRTFWRAFDLVRGAVVR